MQSSRDTFRRYVQTYASADAGAHGAACAAFFAPKAAVEIVHPFNTSSQQALLDSLHGSFSCLTRSDYIAMAGAFEDADWVSSTGYYCGQFDKPWLGIAPTGELAWLRFGEFHRIENGRAVQSFVFLDIPELMIACGQWPIAESPGATRGFTGLQPGPMTQDGLLWAEQDPAQGATSYRMVTDMLAGLATPDEAWRPYWHDHMIWYGPGAFGSFVGIEGFQRFQVPFEGAFAGWSGGSAGNGMTHHFTRFGDGAYVCSGGWPSLTGVQTGAFLGVPASGKRLFMRVSDWWRVEGDKLRENWVFVDIPHVLDQLGVTLLESPS
ncbi:ester cyclase [Pseudaestuariivita sp.]|uniref:ester cyclase n=1 Tax=Pseudaestuariivita sp. TaxID=2211669 RepID=UPI004059A07A